MEQGAHHDIQAEAIAWHIRLRNGGAADWDAFVRWLEGDPARSAAYDAVALADAALTPEAFAAPAANDDEEGRWSTGRRWATALAAAAALFLLGLIAMPWLTAGPDRYEVATAAGQHRTAPLGDGSSVQLNGATRLILDRNDPRFAELVAGEATFSVRHDAAHPFVVVAGDHRVQDAGTTFNLIRDRGRFTVAVIEGSVVYDRGGAAVPLAAGQTLRADQAGRPVVGREDPQAMTGWQRGQLSYRAAPLETVAGDLSRSLGVEVAIDPELMALPFTGSVRVDRDAVTSLASALGLQARRTGDSWLIEPHSRAPR
ncbi:MAG: transrane sensor [Sphingomonadales bacterium]|jgi:transmembrane sensor|nr:transrane sensor [Sphingomonadales bacterium]